MLWEHRLIFDNLAFGRVDRFFFFTNQKTRELARGKEERKRKLRHRVHSHDLKLPREQLFPFRAVSLSNIFASGPFFLSHIWNFVDSISKLMEFIVLTRRGTILIY